MQPAPIKLMMDQTLPLSPRPSERGLLLAHCPHTAHTVHTARARLRLPAAAEPDRRPAARSPQVLPTQHRIRPARSGGSTVSGASACPSRRLYSPRQSHCHTERSIFPDSRWKASHFRRKPCPSPPAYHLLSHRESVCCQGNCTPRQSSALSKVPRDPRSSRTNVSTRPNFQGITVPSRQCPHPSHTVPS